MSKLGKTSRSALSGQDAKRILTAHVDPAVFRDFKILAAEQLATTDIMLNKALELLFNHFKRPVPEKVREKLRKFNLE